MKTLSDMVHAALKAELGEQIEATILETCEGRSCEVEIRGNDNVFCYIYKLDDGSISNRTPEDFARLVARQIANK